MTHPHKSTTHEEQYFHINQEGTVFFRKEKGKWSGSVAVRNAKDNFNKRVGRNVARRRWFNDFSLMLEEGQEPSYEIAEKMFNDMRKIMVNNKETN